LDGRRRPVSGVVRVHAGRPAAGRRHQAGGGWPAAPSRSTPARATAPRSPRSWRCG